MIRNTQSLFLAAALFFPAWAHANTAAHFMFGEPQVFSEVELEDRSFDLQKDWFGFPIEDTTAGWIEGADDAGGASVNALNWLTVIQVGVKIWKIVEENRPVVNAKIGRAHALPKGALRWDDFENWQEPKSILNRVVYTNLFGVDVVDFTYRVLYTPGGSYRGKGRYLKNVTVVPADLSVAWGYRFESEGAVTNTVNAGTRNSPLAAMEISVNWKVDTLLKHAQSTKNYFIRGDGAMKTLSLRD